MMNCASKNTGDWLIYCKTHAFNASRNSNTPRAKSRNIVQQSDMNFLNHGDYLNYGECSQSEHLSDMQT